MNWIVCWKIKSDFKMYLGKLVLSVSVNIRSYLYAILYQPFVVDPGNSCFLHDVDENHT